MKYMRYILYLLAVIALLSTTGCLVPVEVEGRGHFEGHWEHHDHDWDRR